MKCSRMNLNDRRWKPPPRVSKCEGGPIVRQCTQRINLSECPLRHRNRSCRSTSSAQTSHSENSSSSDSQKTPLIIVNLKIAPDVITMAKNNGRQQNNLNRKLPPFCTNYQRQSQSTPNKTNNSVNFNAIQDANMKVINDFIIQGTLIGNHRRQQAVTSGEGISPDIIIDCDECNTNMCDSSINVFNNINTDLLLSLDYYEMDSFGLGRLACDSTHPPTPEIPLSLSNRATSTSRTPTPTLLAVPSGYRPLSLRTPSPNTRAIIRVDLVNRDKKEANLTKDIEYNLNRLKEKRGIRNRSEKSV